MSHHHLIPKLIKGTMGEIKKNRKPGEDKNPVIGAIIGLLFGPAGIGIYFRSWRDFFLCLVVLILISIILVGFGAIPGWIFSAFYGFYRAEKSD